MPVMNGIPGWLRVTRVGERCGLESNKSAWIFDCDIYSLILSIPLIIHK